ncbi:MAG: ribonuclease R [Planctomycetes bacterium]|nr:ribonuclease R [Planctomycetota bacterium]
MSEQNSKREPWEEAIVAFVNQENYRPVKPRVLAEQLNVSEEDTVAFRRVVKRLVKQGKLKFGAKHRVGPPGLSQHELHDRQQKTKHRGETITGTFRRAQGGFGFVRPANTAPSEGRDRDIYIAQEDSLDAATGDVVLVRAKKKGGGKRDGRFGGLRGEIVEIVERQTRRFVGSYFEAGGSAFVQVNGTLFNRPIAVGDPGAHTVQTDDQVVIEMLRFPTQWQDGEAVIVEVLGARGQPGIDTLTVIRQFDLPDEFDDETLQDARAEADRFDESIPPGRTDLTGEVIITIDPIDARDFDDAISLACNSEGHWRLGVHIADVSHFVRPGSALDREAYGRATSVYLPDRVIPMLPELISNGLASLQPDKVRYVKTAFIDFSPEGIRTGVELHSAAIRSRRRFTYEEVDEYLANPEAWREKVTPEVHSLLGRMHELAMILRGRRIKRGALELTMQEIKVKLDKSGQVTGAVRVENTVSHQIIEEFMLAANEAVAEKLADAGVAFLRRVHAAPSPLKLKALNEFMTALGFETEGMHSRFELQQLLKDVAGQPEQYAVNYAVLRSLQRAEYSPVEEGHFALASKCYCHFTSPIRRYPDLTIHRLVNSLVHKGKAASDETELMVQGQHCSANERRAEDAERELVKIKLLTYMQDRIGEEMDAVLTGVESFGLFAQGIELPAEGLIHVTSLEDDRYMYDKATHSLTGRRHGNQYRLGDRVRVKIARVDIERRVLDLRLVRDLGRPQDAKHGGQRHEPRGSKRPRPAKHEKRGSKPTGKPAKRRGKHNRNRE